jgi:hypothetical protein
MAFGQGTTSRVIGTVTDPTGAAVPGAQIRLVSEATNQTFDTTSATNGAYFFEAVQAGLYQLQVEAKGFRKFSSRNNRVSIGQPATINAILEVGSLTEVVEVQETAEAVQTSSSGNFGNVFSEQVIKDLPIVGTRGRNPLDLVTRQPGVVSGANTGGGTHVNGARDRAWNFTIDGVDSNETSAGGSNFSPLRVNPDMLAEFKVLTGNATAEYGRNSGGQVAMVTKSGTNEFHGSAFWFYRTPSLNANEWEFNVNGRGKRQFVQNIPGASAGGAIVKNKLFYYGNFQLLRARESALQDSVIYTPTARQGIWRYVIGGRNQPAGTPGASVDASGNVLPGVNVGTYNIVTRDPSALGIDPRIKGLIEAAPAPNNYTLGDGLNTAAITSTALQSEKQYDVTTKFDYIINNRNTAFARISWGRQDTNCDRGNGGSPVWPGAPCFVNTKRDPQNYAFNWRTTPTTATTNEFVFGINKFAFDFQNPAADLTKVSITSPVARIAEDFTVGNLRRLQTVQFVDNFAWFRGAHNIKFGTNIRLQSHTDQRGSIGGYNSTQVVDFSRSINTVDGATFGIPTDINALDRTPLERDINFFLGRVGATNRGFISDATSYKAGVYDFKANFNEYDFYVQDTWKVSRRLTIDLGLRLEMKMAPSADPADRIRRPDQAAVAGTAGSSTLKWVPGSLYRDDRNNFAPSIGFAYDPFGTGKTSIRGNYRMAYDRINTFVFSSSVFQNLPGIVIGSENVSFGQAGGRLRNLPTVDPPATAPDSFAQPPAFSTRTITVADPNFETPTTHQWGFSIQREVARGMVAEVNYIGRRAYNLFGAYNANQAEVFQNNFANEVQIVKGGGQSTMINQLMGVDTRRRATETGSDAMRRLYTNDLANNALGVIAGDLSRRTTTATGKPLAEAAGFGPNLFLLYPQFASAVNVIDSNDWSTYHAFQAQVEKRFSKGVTFQGSYTFAKSLDSRSFDPAFTVVSTANNQQAGGTPFDIDNRKLNYGLSDFDRRHIVQAYGVWELPFGKGKRFGGNTSGFVNRLIGGWQVSGLASFQGGRPFSVFSGFTTFNNIVQSFANCNGCNRDFGDAYDRPDGIKWYFTPEEIGTMSRPVLGEMGNTGRNFFRGPGSINIDMSFLKRTQITERTNFEFRADMTNFTNTPTFGFPTATLTSATFGRIRDSVISGSRKIQLGAKINF